MKVRKKYFDSELVGRLSRLELMAKRVVDGFLAGKNRSSRHGFSVEFVEHREYAPGDDLRHLDWKVLGRMNRYYIKRYEEETNITACILLDSSASMTYGSGAMTKFECGAFAAAALAYLLNRQRDAVGISFFDDELRHYVPPSAKRVALTQVASQLEGARPSGKTTFDTVARQLAHRLPHRSLVIVLSDLFVSVDSLSSGLKLLEHLGHDVIVLQTLDKDELEFPFRSNVLFRGLEDGRELLVEPARIRKQYLRAFEGFLEAVRRVTEASAFDYFRISSDEPLAPALASALAARTRRRQTIRRRGGAR